MATDEISQRGRALTHHVATTADQRLAAYRTIHAHAAGPDDELRMLQMIGLVDSPPLPKSPAWAPDCGTRLGYRRHMRLGQRACDECLAALREYNAAHPGT